MSPHSNKLLAFLSLFLVFALPSRAADVNAVYNSAADVPVTSTGYTASGIVTFALNFAPATGTSLTVVKNTGLPFISGTFSNLAQGQAVTLIYSGVTFNFVANYYGGTGNDLVLQPANVRPIGWGYNTDGELGNNSTTESHVPTAVLQSGVLSGKTVTAIAAGGIHGLALCSDGTVAGWGYNGDGELGNNSNTLRFPAPVAAVQSGVLFGKTVIAVAAGGRHSLALCSDGTLAAWGSNSNGQLGNNSTVDSNVPVVVVQSGALAGKAVVAIAAGYVHSLALCSDGTVVTWGWNNYGQLGNNTTTQSLVPVAVFPSGVLSGKTVVALSAGTSHCLALCSDGTLAAWGYNGDGELGVNSTTDSQVPVAVFRSGVLAGKTVTAVTSGSYHNLVLCSDGTVAAWGDNVYGELGIGDPYTFRSTVPVMVPRSGAIAGKVVHAIAAGGDHSLALCSDGAIATWGYNGDGQLGNNSTENSDVPVAVNTSTLAAGERFVAVANGKAAFHSLALVASSYAPMTTTLPATSLTLTGATLNGTVNANSSSAAVSFDYGPSASYGTTVAGTPATVTGNSTTAVSTVLTGLTSGATYHYRVNGTNGAGTSSGNDLTFTTPTTNADLANLTLNSGTLSPAFATGTTSYTATITSSNIMAVTATTADPNATVRVNGATVTSGLTSDPLSMAIGTNTVSIVVTAPDGVTTRTYTVTMTVTQDPPPSWTYNTADDVPVSANGYNAAGNTVNFALNFAPPAGTNLTLVKNAGLFFIGGTFSNLAQGQMVTLNYGGIGYNFVANYYGGDGRDLVLQWANVRPMTWGYNADGELGNNSTTNSPVPVAVVRTSGPLFDKTVTSLSVGGAFTLALCSDGTVAGWGQNNFGQLGNNSTTGSSVPVTVLQSGVLSGKTVIAVAAGAYHSLALCSDGTLATWGDNDYGQLGNNSNVRSTVPIAVDRSGILSGKTVVGIAAGMYHCLVLCSDGTLAAWGWNGDGQLGNNSTTDSHVPVAVIQNSGALLGKTVVKMTCGAYHNLVLCSDGTLVAWGSNGFGALGNNSTTDSPVPVAVIQTGAFASKTVIALAAAVYTSMGLCSDGTLATWGQNSYGELGNNTTTDSHVPIVINQFGALAGKMVVKVAAGAEDCFALCSDGTLAAWGDNAGGKLGNNSTTQSKVPVLVSTSALAAGERFASDSSGVAAHHSAALIASLPSPLATTIAATSVTKTGATLNGAVNPNSNISAVSFDYGMTSAYGTNVAGTPTPVTGNTASPVSATLTGLTPGTTYHFRVNGVNAVGTGNGNDLTFRTISDNANLSNLALSSGALSPAFASGTTNYTADVPNATPSITVTPTMADSTSTVRVNGAVVASGSASSVMNLNVGANNITIVVTAQDGVTTQTYTVVATLLAAPPLSWTYQTAGDIPVTASGYAASGTATLALNFAPPVGTNLMVVKNSGAAFIRGMFTNLVQGQMVTLTYNGMNYPFVVTYYGGSGNDLVLQWVNVRPWAWGFNGSGQLGINNTTNSTVPVAALQSGVLAGKTVIATATGQAHSLALCSDGTLAAWGLGTSGQLGNNSTTTSLVPVPVLQSGVLGGKTVIAIAAGASHSLALCSDGTVAAWGYNGNGQLGSNGPFQSTVPIAVVRDGVLAGKTVIAISAGGSHSLALCSDGTLAAWGLGSSGQLGNNSTFSGPIPVAVSQSGVLSGKTVIAISAGGSHSLALCSDGTLAAWGLHSSGQLGNNATTPMAVLQSGVLAGKTVIAITTGQSHNLVLCSDGTVAAWGLNTSGQLGNNSTAQSFVPVNVLQTGVLSGKTVIAVSGGASHSLALCSDGTLAAWGLGASGQLGNNSTSSSSVPVTVSTSSFAPGERFAAANSGPLANHALALVASLPQPTVTTFAATSITTTGATLNGTVNGNNNDTAVAFDYGTTTSYGASVVATPGSVSGSSATAVTATLTGLTPGVTYHYRVNGVNAAGASNGNDLTFTVPVTQLNNLNSWRQTCFPGSTSTTGPGADTATPQNDGVSNLIKFATGMDPTQAGVMPGTVSVAGHNLLFTYTPSAAAVADGFIFTVQYSDALTGGVWASDIVNQGVIGLGGTPVTATVPIGSSSQRFLHLTIKSP